MTTPIPKRLQSLSLTYPLWLFDPDQPPYPRKLSSLLPSSLPAKPTGWCPWGWEYGTTLYRLDDPAPPGVTVSRGPGSESDIQRRLGDPARILEGLRWDDGFGGEGTFEVVFLGRRHDNNDNNGRGGEGEREREGEGEGDAERAMVGTETGTETKDFEDWVHEPGTEGHVDPRRVLRIVRKWDGVPFWDRERGWNLFDAGHAETYRCFGVASLVRNEAELVAAAGTRKGKETGEKIRRAEIELLGLPDDGDDDDDDDDDDDGGGEMVRGIVFPERWQNNERGLILSRGPGFAANVATLAGTALEGRPWSEVEEYVYGKRTGPLW